MFLPILLSFIIAAVYGELKEPKCLSSFDFHLQLLYKVVKMEEEMNNFRSYIKDFKKESLTLEKNREERLYATLITFKTESEQHFQRIEENSQTVLGNMDTSSMQLEKKVELLTKLPAVGFSVREPKETTKSRHMTFNNVLTNVGDGYDTATGLFTCNVPGYYYFAASLLSAPTHSGESYCWIYKNTDQQVIARTDSPANGRYAATNSVFVHLERGDIVKLAGCTPLSTLNPYSSFTGLLVTPDTL